MIGESIICEDMNFFAFIQTFYIAGLLISCVSRKLFKHLNVINLKGEKELFHSPEPIKT